MAIPQKGDKVIESCFNCDMEFEQPQAIGDPCFCDPDEGGCGWRFRLSTITKHLKDKKEESE